MYAIQEKETHWPRETTRNQLTNLAGFYLTASLTAHMCLPKGILGVKRTTPNWSVLRECGQEPLQFYWFRAAVRFYNALLCSYSSTLAKVLKADIAMSIITRSAGVLSSWMLFMVWKGTVIFSIA